MNIAILTDSNSGITQDEAKKLGVYVLPMPFYINGKLYYEEITLSQEDFYEFLKEDAEISTSQPSPGEVTDMWDSLLKDHDSIVYIPMSSGLSGSMNTARMLAEDYEGKVEVVDNQRISVTLRQSVLDAKQLADAGKSAAQIREILEKVKFDSSIYITLETLKYLKKGGRITPAAAAIGTVLNLKPVLQIQGDKLDAYTTCRSKKASCKAMIDALQKDIDTRFADDWNNGRKVHMALAYSGNLEEGLAWKAQLEEAFPGIEFTMAPLSLSISCHIGYGCLAATITSALPESLLS